MYGVGVGTGASGAIMIFGITVGSFTLAAFAVIALIMMMATLFSGIFGATATIIDTDHRRIGHCPFAGAGRIDRCRELGCDLAA